MRILTLSLSNRFTLMATLIIAVLAISCLLVIRSLYDVEETIDEKIVSHTKNINNNSLISREIFQLSSSVQLLEQTFLYDEDALNAESLFIDNRLQSIRSLSDTPEFVQRMDIFIETFHRFMGNSLSLNHILQEQNHIDEELGKDIDQLELAVFQSYLYANTNQATHKQQYEQSVNLVNTLRESYLSAGKLTASIRSRITPDTEEVLIIAVLNKIEIIKLHLNNANFKHSESQTAKSKILSTLGRYTAMLRKMQANLAQRWKIMDSLLTYQNELLLLVSSTEKDILNSARDIKEQLNKEITSLRTTVGIVAVIIVFASLLIFSRMVRNHIKSPINTIIQGIDRFEQGKSYKNIDLARKDEWSTIEQAFNKMVKRLQESYNQLLSERLSFDYLAHHDPLTGLSNRLFIYEELERLISLYEQQDKKFSLIYLDLDQFKDINDSMGHSVGDKLLKDIARQLSKVIGDKGTVVRLGGDEFMVVFPDIEDLDEVENHAKELNMAMTQPFLLNDKPVFISISIGICQYPVHGKDVETLIRNADTAMYQAKQEGRNCYRQYQDSMTKQALELVQKSSGIHVALKNNECELLYQPQFNLRTKKLCGAEALIRWHHPEMGMLTPDKFLPVAEQTGLITMIDDWVIRQVAQQVVLWQEQGLLLKDMKFSVNFSGRKFLEKSVIENISKMLDHIGCEPQYLEIEITEQDIMTNLDQCISTMEALRAQGLSFAIDDFGTGYSSFSYLKNLPADTLKIDRSFIRDITESSKDMAIVKTMISLASMMEIEVVAEGIETSYQQHLLQSHGCHKGQGYHLAYPVKVEEITRQLQHYQGSTQPFITPENQINRPSTF